MLKGLQGSLLLLLKALSHVAYDHISCPASLLQFVSITQYVIVQIREYISRDIYHQGLGIMVFLWYFANVFTTILLTFL